MFRYIYLSAFLCVLFVIPVFAQSGSLEIIEAHWIDDIQAAGVGSFSKLSSPTSVNQPYLRMTIQGDRALYEKWINSKEIPLRFVWYAQSRILIKRKSLKVESDFDFRDSESLKPIEVQLDSTDTFTMDIWSRSFRRLREGEVQASLMYKNNKPVRVCEDGECTFQIKIAKQ